MFRSHVVISEMLTMNGLSLSVQKHQQNGEFSSPCVTCDYQWIRREVLAPEEGRALQLKSVYYAEHTQSW